MQTVCWCGLLIASVADFHHAYGDFQRGVNNPDRYYPETERWLSLLQDYCKQRGPVRFGQILRGKVSEGFFADRNLAYFHDYLEVPEGYTSFYLDHVAKFQGITNEEAKIAIQNIKVTVERDARGQDWFGTRTNLLPRAKFFARIRRYDSEDALLAALEREEIHWRSEAAVCALPASIGSPSTEQGHVSGADDTVQFESVTPERYSITYNISRPGIIFVSQAFYPGWVATDPHVKLTEVFGAFQGIVVPEAGRGTVVARFSPPALKIGAAITLITATVAVSLVVSGWRRGLRDS